MKKRGERRKEERNSRAEREKKVIVSLEGKGRKEEREERRERNKCAG